MPEVFTLGESMLIFGATEPGPLRYCNSFRRTMGGAEANVAIGLTRLGHEVAWFSKLGQDEAGEYIRSTLRGEGVDVSRVIMVENGFTGLYLKERPAQGDPRVFYYRKGSAASSMSPDDLPEDYVARARLLHVTGITPALSRSCKEAVFSAIEIARSYGVLISFDPNMRRKLWTPEEATPVMREMAAKADIIMPGASEGAMITGVQEPGAMAKAFLKMGARAVAVKLGAGGAMVASQDGVFRIPPYKVDPIDTIGAGDAFDAAFLAYYLEGFTAHDAGVRACVAGALATLVYGDWEGLPSREQLELSVSGHELISR